ncbi:MAG: hypothetical protein ACOC7T_02345 [Planctomycetota bacterium]
MEHWELAFNGAWPAPLVLTAAAACAALAYMTYRARAEELSPAAFRLLVGLRVAAVLVPALFLLEPVLRVSRSEAREGTVAVLVDASESMGIRDAPGGRARLEAAADLLREPPADLLQRLGRSQAVRLFAFGALPAELPGAARVDELRPDQKASALGDALERAVREVGAARASAVVMLSDGAQNRGRPAEQAARELGVPVYAVAVGGRPSEAEDFVDIAVADVPEGPRLIVDNRARLEVGLSGAGLEGLPAEERGLEVRLLSEGEKLASRTVRLPADGAPVRTELEFTPRRAGLRRLTVRAPVLPGEVVPQNNSRPFIARVSDPRIRLLIVEGTARNEYRFLRRVLESDPHLEVTSVVRLSRGRFLQQGVQSGVDLSGGLPTRAEDLARFDAVVLGDIGRDQFTGLQLDRLREFVADGGGLLATGGHSALGAGGYADTALADALPVALGGRATGHVDEEFVPELTPAGGRHPLFAGCGRFFAPTAADGVTLEGCNRVSGLKPGARALLVHPSERAGDEPLPVVAAHRYGSGRALSVGFDTSWKWKFQVEAAGRDSPYFRFWRQAVRWLASYDEPAQRSDEAFTAWPGRLEYAEGEAVLLKARLADEQGATPGAAVVTAKIRFPAPVETGEGTRRETTVNLAPAPLSPGRYQAQWQPPTPGLYRASVTARLNDEPAGADQFEFAVGGGVSEFARIDVDSTVLRNLAGATGGAYHTLASARRIPEQLERKRRTVLRWREISLWNAPWLFALFLGCVAAEWILRRRRALD